MLDILLCHAQQLQLFLKKAGYEYDKFGTAGFDKSPAALPLLSSIACNAAAMLQQCCSNAAAMLKSVLLDILLCHAQQLQLFFEKSWI
jgi:hypothetical protein